MSKIHKIEKCGFCSNQHDCECFARDKNGHLIFDVGKMDTPTVGIRLDCPLPDSDAWKKELLEWIEREAEKYYPVNPDEDRKIIIINSLNMVKQQIQEM